MGTTTTRRAVVKKLRYVPPMVATLGALGPSKALGASGAGDVVPVRPPTRQRRQVIVQQRQQHLVALLQRLSQLFRRP